MGRRIWEVLHGRSFLLALEHSHNIIDTRPLCCRAKGFWFEPSLVNLAGFIMQTGSGLDNEMNTWLTTWRFNYHIDILLH